MKKMIRIGAAVCIIAAFTSFTPSQKEVQTPATPSADIEVIACL